MYLKYLIHYIYRNLNIKLVLKIIKDDYFQFNCLLKTQFDYFHFNRNCEKINHFQIFEISKIYDY